MWKPNETEREYSNATLNIFKALDDLKHAIKHEMQGARLVVAWNKNLKFGIKIKNPETKKISAWESSYGLPHPPDPKQTYWNKTEKMLVEKYTQTFATEEAIRLYEDHGIVINDLFKGVGKAYLIPCEVKRQWRLEKDGYDLETNPWFHGHIYNIKDNIKRWVANPLTPIVFTVVFKRNSKQN